jgi:hypothetical protein
MKPEKKNETRQQLSAQAKKAFLRRFSEDCSRALRGGLTEEELIAAVNQAVVKEVQES